VNSTADTTVLATGMSVHDDLRRRAMWLLAAALLATAAVHYPTYASMVQIWLRSDTFLHGFLIFPISAYLIRRRWPVLRTLEVKPFYPGLLAVFAVSVAWWLSDMLGIQVGKQLMAVSMLPLFVLVLAGPQFARAIAFPLGYLVFAVPFGEAIIPYLIDFTAFFTVEALQLTGIAVLRDGVFFSIPSGNFEVAKACSGIRYLLASLALGTLYGYMIYESVRKRLLFFLFALLLPIVANGLRAYGIVLLAHYSDMKIAVGVDHLIFGWIFFGVVMLLMFWVGDRYRDRAATQANGNGSGLPIGHDTVVPLKRIAPAAGVAIALVILGPALAYAVSRLEADASAAGLPSRAGSWRMTTVAERDWRPAYVGASYERIGSYEKGGQLVDLAVIRYDAQKQGVELANAVNAVAEPKEWRFGRTAERQLVLDGIEPLAVREAEIHRSQATRPQATRLVWSWNEVNGEPVTGDLQTKWHEATSLLSLQLPLSAAVIVSAPVAGDPQAAGAILEDFLASSWTGIHNCLYPRLDNNVACVADIDEQEARER
jgi:exosortase A